MQQVESIYDQSVAVKSDVFSVRKLVINDLLLLLNEGTETEIGEEMGGDDIITAEVIHPDSIEGVVFATYS